MRLELHVLTDVLTNTMLSLKQPGEEYSAVKNKLQSTVLGREEVKDITRLAVKDNERGARFQLPEFSNKTMAEVFAETPEVGVQVKYGSRAFSHDVAAAMLVFQSNETAAILVSQTNPVGVELSSYVDAFVFSNKSA